MAGGASQKKAADQWLGGSVLGAGRLYPTGCRIGRDKAGLMALNSEKRGHRDPEDPWFLFAETESRYVVLTSFELTI